VAIAAGAELGGRRAVAMFQNSGLGNAVNPLTSLTHTFRIPILIIVTWRGEPGGAADEPQHELMGQITPRMLETMGIPWALFPRETGDVGPALDRAVASLEKEGRPFALVMQKGSVADCALEPGRPMVRPPRAAAPAPALPSATRLEILRAVQAATGPGDVLVATTGYTGRELAALDDRPNQLYMVGSMGCAASLGLGLALARPERRIIVLDGDGAALMRMGVLATLGHELPPNLLHLVLDNGRHESTGGQATVSATVDFCGVAAASGYPVVQAAGEPARVQALVADRAPGLRFIHVPTRPGVAPGLPRPTVKPPEVAARLRRHLATGS
jgi:phosphonopyruvate decarboxylase